MALKIYAHEFEEILYESKSADYQLTTDENVREETIRSASALGSGSYQRIYLDNITIGYGQAHLADNLLLHYEADHATVEMHFNLSGSSLTTDRHLQHPLAFQHHQHNIVYGPSFKGRVEWGQQQPLELFEVNMAPAFFHRHIANGPGLLHAFGKKIDQAIPALLCNHNLVITPQMLMVIKSIIHCPRTGIFKQLLIEGKVLELLLLQLEQFTSHDCRAFCSLKKTDIDKIYQARDIIASRPHAPCSLLDLAQLIGTNEFTLKKGFKEIFGTTVFGYLQEIKMEQAHRMILEGKNINEVADFTGYKHHSHFTAAFKRKFGLAPGKLKQNR
ncbi:helix-turn-helix transcriptional regulator [Chitinophaga nivalis]|uniref:AraC family transcriptional regulator n=1 Tax=Chitinophaga nivalis TaxID=2991709 RepID=A0ABT3IJ52_9BACT|nr:AraC family transcriptional regulator [Chitinophaga nivalis]MCW3466311.1 AraC family transcriptional regulator [Chitinophaga nivalis]MCW3483998.1 AraC family transcriptional regulator [Chitinophaga nivalis]